jgi:glyoxylase-like metal-dependent hydrolase (beta-lactamase superfamily II)
VGVGGRAAVEGLRAFTVSASSRRYAVLEGPTPDSGTILGSTFSSTLTHDLGGRGLRADIERRVLFLGFNAEQRFSEIVRGDVGHVAGIESVFGAPTGDMTSERRAAVSRQQRLLNPHYLVRAALAEPSRLVDGGFVVLDDELHHALIYADETAPVILYVNAKTGELSKLTTGEVSPLLRDVDVDVYFQGWTATAGGPRFPQQVVVALDDEVVLVETRRSVSVSMSADSTLFDFPMGAAPTFDAMAAARGARRHQFHLGFAGVGIPLDQLQTNVVATELAPGVHHLTGGSHNSLVVEQSAGLVLFEAPLYEERSQAIARWAAQTYPGKTITHVVVSHFHEDHSAGVRTFAARGATIVIGAASEALFRRALAAPSSLEPDELTQSARAWTLVVVPRGGSWTLADALRPVEAHAIDVDHAADMLAGYVRGAQIAFASDVYSPGIPGSPVNARQYYDGITRAGLTPTSIAGAHGGVASPAALRMAAGL